MEEKNLSEDEEHKEKPKTDNESKRDPVTDDDNISQTSKDWKSVKFDEKDKSFHSSDFD